MDVHGKGIETGNAPVRHIVKRKLVFGRRRNGQ
jgi:hypothetical protein